MKHFMQWFKKQITVADIAIILFLIAGFYYTTNYKFSTLQEDVQRTKTNLNNHMEYRFRPLQEQVKENSDRIIRIEGSYESIRDLLEQQRETQNKRFTRVEKQLDYIISRIDND